MKRNKIRLLGRDILFVLLCISIFFLASYLVRPIWIGNDVSRDNIAGFYGEKRNTLDVIYTGGSCVYTYYNPVVAYNESGFTSYDLSYNGAFSDLYIYFVKEALKTQKPKLYILDLRAFELRPDTYVENEYRGNIIPGINSMNYSLNRLNAIMNLVPRGERLSMLFDISMYHNRWQMLDKDSFKYISNRVKNDTKGHQTLNETQKVELARCTSDSIDECAYVSEESQRVFEDLCVFCSKQSFKTLFIVPPSSDGILEERMKIYNTYKKIIDKYGMDYINCIDYYDTIGMDGETDYYNEKHTNPFGSYKYSVFLSRYLAEKYDLPDHRNDADYSEWDDCYKEYLISRPDVVERFGLKEK